MPTPLVAAAPAPLFRPMAAPQVSLGNTAGNLGEAIGSVVAGSNAQRNLQQQLALKQAMDMIAAKKANDLGNLDIAREVLYGQQGTLDVAKTGLANNQAGMIAPPSAAQPGGGPQFALTNALADLRNSQTGINKNILSTWTRPGTSAGPGTTGGKSDLLKQKQDVERQISQIDAEEAQFNRANTVGGMNTANIPTVGSFKTHDFAHSNPAAFRQRQFLQTKLKQLNGQLGPGAETKPETGTMSAAGWQATLNAIKAAGGDTAAFMRDHPQPSQ